MTANQGFDAPVSGNRGVNEGTEVSPSQCDGLPQSNNGSVIPTLAQSPSAGSSSTPGSPLGGGESSVTSNSPGPPITKESLRELEVSKIINNLKLRHDINFDPGLHFRPNVEGEMGQRKLDRANQFWTALKEQLMEFITDRPSFDRKHGTQDDWCLPTLLKTVRDIIQTLLPQQDHRFLDEGLNVDLLMQQFYHGITDLEKLALWLSHLLKSHCAPMRDEWVDATYNQLSNRNNDIGELVEGMRSLLSLLEAMKLDVANHHIRSFRVALIEETIPFEQKMLKEKLRNRKMNIDNAKPWYRNAAKTYSDNGATGSSSFGDMGIFFEGLSRSMLPSAGDKPLPGTFFYDEDRLGRVRSDILDAINLDVCMRMYEDLERQTQFNTTPAFSHHASGDEPLTKSMSSNEFNFNTPLSPSGLASSALSLASPTSSFPRSTAEAHNIRHSLVALLQQAPPKSYGLEKWRSMAASMALQISRFTNAPSERLLTFEEEFTENVSKTTSPIFEKAEEAYRAQLVEELATRVRDFKSLSQVDLYFRATSIQVTSSSRFPSVERNRDPDTAIQEGGIEDIATRIAHVGVVHWKIWNSMAYVDGDGLS